MVDRIEAWLRMRDVARFNRDAKSASNSVEKIGDEVEKTDKKLKLMNKETKKSKGLWDTLGISFSGAGKKLDKFSGRLQIAAALIAVLGPSLVSVAASAGAAAVGFGLLAATAGGAAVVGFLGLGLVMGQTLSGLGKIRSAQEAYTLAVAQHGKWSDEALSAQERLNAEIGINGGKSVMKLLNAWDALKKSFKAGTASARNDVIGGLVDSIGAANKIMPTFTRETNRNVKAVRDGLVPALQDLTGPEGQQGIRTLSKTFRGVFGPVVQGGVDLLLGLFRYIRQAAPWVVSAAKGFASWAKSFRDSSKDTGLVNSRVSMLVGHFLAWLGLAKALGRLLMQIFRDSNAAGGNLVTHLTAVVDKFTAWIAAGDGTSWFNDFADVSKKIGAALGVVAYVVGQLVTALIPALHSGAEGLGVVFGVFLLRLEVLTDVIEFLGPLTGPLIVAFVALKIATLAWAAATTLLGIAMRLTPLGWIVTGIALVIAAVILMWNHFEWFRVAVTAVWNAIKWAFNAAWEFLKNNWKLLPLILLGPLAPVALLIIKFWDQIKGAFAAVWGFIKDNWKKLPILLLGPLAPVAIAIIAFWDQIKGAFVSAFNGIKNAFKAIINWVLGKWNSFSIGFDSVKVAGHTIIPGFRWNTPDIPLMAQGGSIGPGGVGIVGDAGPELASNDGRNTTITPLSKVPGGAKGLDGTFKFHFEIPVMMAGREVGRASADQTSDWNARKGR